MSEIKYSDLIEDDGAIRKAIDELIALKQAFNEVSSLVKSEAINIKTNLQQVSTATDSGRQSMGRMVDESSRLKRAQDELEFAMSETGAKVAELKMLINETNKSSRDSAKLTREQEDSYNKLKISLEESIAAYKKLTAEQRNEATVGEAMLKRIQILRAELKNIDNQLKANTTTTRKRTSELNAMQKAEERLAYALSDENSKVIALNASTREANRIAKLNVIVANNAEGSYNKLSAQYELNKIALNKMSFAERENTEQGKKLVEKTKALMAEMIRLQEATGKHTLSVGNYKKAWDGVRMGTDQIIREMPVLGISMNTFFLAISNNIPILVDEINKVRDANKQAAKENKAQVSIWKSVRSAIFSFNAVLIILVTILSRYGTVIFDWIGSLFKAKSAIDSLTTAQKALIYITTESAGQAKGQIQNVIELGVQIRKYGDDAKYAKNIISSFNDIFKTHYTSIEQIRLAYPKLAKEMIDMAVRMAAAQKLIDDAAQQVLRRQQAGVLLQNFSPEEINTAKKNIRDFFNWRKTFLINAGASEAEAIKSNNKLFRKLGESGFKQTNLFMTKQTEAFTAYLQKALGPNERAKVNAWFGNVSNDLIKGVVNTIGSDVSENIITEAIESLYEGTLSNLVTTTSTRNPRDRTEQIEKANLDIIKRYEQSVTDLILDEYDNRTRGLRDSFEAEKRELLNKQANDKDLTEQNRKLISETILNMEKKLTTDLELNEYDRQIALLEIQEEGLALQENSLLDNTYQAMDLRLQILEIQRQKELVSNRKLIESERQDEFSINAKWDALISQARKKDTYAIEMELFEIASKIREAEFNAVKHTETAKTKFKLLEERKRWQLLVLLAEQGSIQATDGEIKSFKALIKAIDFELSQLMSKGFNIYEALGFDSREQKAIQEALKVTVGFLNEIFQAEKQLADQAVELAKKRVDAAKSALDAEIEARNNGYAFNVSQAKRELEAARQEQREKLKLQEDAAKRQEALNTISQSSSLITAAANIWATFSKIPGFGVPLALGAIATMFGSFAIAKVRASQVTRNNSEVESYGEGGLEMLEGGSHASGNDIPIGKTSKGKDRRAEGGEALAVINKRNTRKYKALLPDLIESLNKGTFEKRYLNSFMDSVNLNVALNQDFSNIENDVKSIRENAETKYLQDSNGRLIRKYKNLTTIYQ